LIKGNYHTHTYRCKHAEADVADYVKAAVDTGLEILGISDHTPLPDDRWIEMRMHMNELESYIKAIDDAKQKFPQIIILKGMECEYLQEYHSFYSEELLEKHKFDYLSASAHFFPYKGEWVSGWEMNTRKELAAYAEYVVQMMKTGLFDYVAHPDMFGGSYPAWDKDAIACSRYILEAAEEFKIPLEINAYGFRKHAISTSDGVRPMYPWIYFWELASQYRVTVTVNSDAHRPEDIVGRMEDAFNIAEKYGLKLAEYTSFCNKRNVK
jgi:histidinol-phosphatase (PHP family)